MQVMSGGQNGAQMAAMALSKLPSARSRISLKQVDYLTHAIQTTADMLSEGAGKQKAALGIPCCPAQPPWF